MKEKIANGIKFFLFTFMMINGFFFTYMFTWFAVGLPQENWAVWLTWVLALLSEYGYVKWITEG